MRAQSLLTLVALSTLLLLPTAALAEPPVAPPTQTIQPMDGHPLYFAVELKKDGRVVGRPKLLGAEGKRLAVEKKQPGAQGFDYRLVLFPHQNGDKYELTLDVAMPGTSYHYDLQLLHGEVQRVGEKKPSKGAGFEVELLVLKVDSPEFRALMNLSADAPRAQPSI
ncbi:MAG: hypothetical protein M3Y59_01120 [Myxococcota bacterium]|nr:hypothetical protein [Myxococcota bacterium]